MDELDVKNLIPPIIDLFIFSKKGTFSAQGFTYNLATIHMLSLSRALDSFFPLVALVLLTFSVGRTSTSFGLNFFYTTFD